MMEYSKATDSIELREAAAAAQPVENPPVLFKIKVIKSSQVICYIKIMFHFQRS